MVYKKRKKITEETRRKMSESKMGEKNPNWGKRGLETSMGCRKGKDSPMYGKCPSKKTREKISKSLKGKYAGKNGFFYDRKHTKETKLKMSIKKKGKYKGEENSMYGKKHTEVTKQKMRVFTNNQIKKQVSDGLPSTPTVGHYETEILDVLEKCIGYTIIRQYQVGKYCLDGYCPNYQLAIEIDGPRHERRIGYDRIREKEIKKKIKCQFIRIKVPL